MDTIRFAVVGTGHLGKHHTRILSKFPGVELVGISDIRDDILKTIGSEYGVTGYKNYLDLIQHVDAVVIATPTSTHYEICMAFLKAKKHVFVEKPISADLEQARTMVKTAREEQCILQVGHSERFNPAFIAAQPFIKNPKFIESHRLNVFSPRGTDVDVILDLMIHDLDIILHFMNDFPAKLDSIGIPVLSKEIDIANARLAFRNGAVANLTASRVSVNPIRKFRIFQKDTYISIDFKEQNVAIFNRLPSKNENELPLIRQIPVEITRQEPLFLENSEFVHSIRSGKDPQITGEVGMNALKAALAILDGIQVNPLD